MRMASVKDYKQKSSRVWFWKCCSGSSVENHLEEDERRGRTPLRKQYQHERRVSVAQSCLTLCEPVDCNPPGSSSVHAVLQARILEWVVIPFSRGSSQTRDRTRVSCTAGGLSTAWAPSWETGMWWWLYYSHVPQITVEWALCTFQMWLGGWRKTGSWGKVTKFLLFILTLESRTSEKLNIQ